LVNDLLKEELAFAGSPSILLSKVGGKLDTNREFTIYPDKRRYILSIIVFAFFIYLEAQILFIDNIHWIWKILIGVLMVFFAWQIYANVKIIMQNKPMLIVSEKGIHDLTSSVDLGIIPWKYIDRIDLYMGGNSLQIGVGVSPNFQLDQKLPQATSKQVMRNLSRTGYAVSIDGFNFGNKRFREIFAKLKEYGTKYNSSIIFKEYEDPLLKKARENREARLAKKSSKQK